MTQLNQNTTDLQSILDAVNALPEASNTEIGVSYNADGTQNLIIKDDGSVIEIPDPNPVLLWTNASPTSAFGNQTITVDYSQYDALLIENKSVYWANPGVEFVGLYYPSQTIAQFLLSQNENGSNGYVGISTRKVTFASGNKITFASSSIYQGNSYSSGKDDYAIPTRIWGVKFTL